MTGVITHLRRGPARILPWGSPEGREPAGQDDAGAAYAAGDHAVDGAGDCGVQPL